MNSANLIAGNILSIRTPAAQWAYAARADFAAVLQDCEAVRIRVVAETNNGRAGIGVLNITETDFIEEREIYPGHRETVEFVLPTSGLGPLIVRNRGSSGASTIMLHSVEVFPAPRIFGFPSLVRSRDFAGEARPEGGDSIVFNDSAADSINAARLEHLDSLGLNLTNRRVLDVGCGVGHFTSYYRTLGCDITGVDGRAENINEMARRYPDVPGYVMDAQLDDLRRLGTFDVIHCYGLIYHLDSPVAAMRNMANVCADLMIIETIVCDSRRALMLIEDETKTVNQALEGMGCRPSPPFMALALNRIGFPYVYGARTAPNHPDFQFEWQDNLESQRNGHNLRSIFVASRRKLENAALQSLVA